LRFLKRASNIFYNIIKIGGFIMKKRILCLAAALVMSMSSTAFAAGNLTVTPRNSGDVTDADTKDGGDAAAYEGLTAYDAALIYQYSKTGQDLGTVEKDGDFDGKYVLGKAVNVTDANTVLGYVRDPKLTKSNALQFTTSSAKFTNLPVIDLPEDKYTDATTIKDFVNQLLEDNLSTLDQNLGNGKSAIDYLNTNLGKVNFYSADLGKQVYITEEDGWKVFVKAIEPLLACNGTTVYIQDGIYKGFVDEEKSTGDAYTQLAEVKKLVVNGSKTATLTSADVKAIVNAAETGLPGDKLTTEAIQTAYANVKAIMSSKGDINSVDFTFTKADGTQVKMTADEIVNTICEKELYKYDTKTIKDVTDAFGTAVTVNKTTKSGKTFSVTAELSEIAKTAK
jgi:hypothetical protein